MEEKIAGLYSLISTYLETKHLNDATRALSFIRKAMEAPARSAAAQNRHIAELLHSLEVCEMLVDLHPAITPEEEDRLLSAVLLHVYPESFGEDSMDILSENGFDDAVCAVVAAITPDKDLDDEEQQEFYEKAQTDKLVLLALLADRGNIVQQLYRFSTWNAHRYIDETKACFYPMCIYGKEHYHELLAPISVLMEKMRSLIEVAEILLRRYEIREAELNQDILALREENATIKGIIAKFTAGR